MKKREQELFIIAQRDFPTRSVYLRSLCLVPIFFLCLNRKEGPSFDFAFVLFRSQNRKMGMLFQPILVLSYFQLEEKEVCCLSLLWSCPSSQNRKEGLKIQPVLDLSSSQNNKEGSAFKSVQVLSFSIGSQRTVCYFSQSQSSSLLSWSKTDGVPLSSVLVLSSPQLGEKGWCIV